VKLPASAAPRREFRPWLLRHLLIASAANLKNSSSNCGSPGHSAPSPSIHSRDLPVYDHQNLTDCFNR
jgi:hypothetical protein